MNEQQKEPGFEDVFTVTSFHDGPRQGVASFNGAPHFFDCVFSDENDNYTDRYQLTPISQAQLEIAQEDWAIFRQWELAFHTGETGIDTHPALPPENTRHEELKGMLESILKTNSIACVLRTGLFQAIDATRLPRGVLRPMRVKWTE